MKQKRDKFSVLFSPEEKQIITDKAYKYGYGGNMSEYIRDASIYENIYIENIEGKQEIFKYIDEYSKELKEHSNNLNEISKKVTLTKTDILFIKEQSKKIIDSLNRLIKTVMRCLIISFTPQLQARLKFIEKNKVTNNFIDTIISRKISLIQPSSLKLKRLTNTKNIIYKKFSKSFNITDLNYENLTNLINEQRSIALQYNYYILFRTKNEKLEIELAKSFTKDYDYKNVYNQAIELEEIIEIIDLMGKEE